MQEDHEQAGLGKKARPTQKLPEWKWQSTCLQAQNSEFKPQYWQHPQNWGLNLNI
jgi:hypothetical protein